MQRAAKHAPAGEWPAADAVGDIALDFDARHRRRIRLETSTGEAVLLDLADAIAMAGGDGVQTSDGRWFAIRAKPEPLLEVTAPDPLALMRLAWHLGNRHTPAEVQASRVLIRRDHVLAEMVRGLGGSAREIEEPFQPEGGAYGGHAAGAGHEHVREHDHSHTHDHSHSHSHDHD